MLTLLRGTLWVGAFLFQGATQDALVFVGAAGCDGDDSNCARDSPESERVIWKYTLSQGGHMQFAGHVHVPGVPAWLLAAPQLPHCLFSTLVTSDEVAAFSVSQKEVTLRMVVASGGVNPVFASVTADGQHLLVANYHGPDDIKVSKGASVASFTIASDCSLTLAAVIPHSGTSVVRGRQDAAHPHSFVAAAHGRWAFACDLGMDTVTTYEVRPDGTMAELHRASAGAGDGPRHIVLHPEASFAYVVNELANSVRVYSLKHTGALIALESYSTLAAGDTPGVTKAAELALSSDGKTLYASNRGQQNSVCIFSVLESGARLQQIRHVEVPAFPRGMVLSRDSNLLVASQHFGTIETFVASGGGGLTPASTNVTGPPTAATLALVEGDSLDRTRRAFLATASRQYD